MEIQTGATLVVRESQMAIFVNQVFVRSLIEAAHGMGKLAVAECVEDAQTLQLLRTFGVDMVQGYHLDRPQAQHPALQGF